MRTAVSLCIKEVLGKGKSVYFKGIGRLRYQLTILNSDGVDSSLGRGQPGLLLLRKKAKKNKALVKLIAAKFELKRPRAIEIIELYSSSLSKKLRKTGLASIPEVAIFARTSNNEIVVRPIELATDQRFGLNLLKHEKVSSVSEPPIQINEEPEQTLFSVQEKNFNNEEYPQASTDFKPKGNNDNLDEARELELIQASLPDHEELKSVLKDHFYQDTGPNVEPSDLGQNRNANHAYKKTSLPKSIAKKKPNKKLINNKIAMFLGAISILILCGLLVSALGTSQFEQQSNSVNGLIELPEEQLKESQLARTEYNETKADNSSSLFSNKCIIITGSFSNPINEIRMKNVIRQLGYDVFYQNIGNLVRVGLELECNDLDFAVQLQQIRQETKSPEAWYLEPSHLREL